MEEDLIYYVDGRNADPRDRTMRRPAVGPARAVALARPADIRARYLPPASSTVPIVAQPAFMPTGFAQRPTYLARPIYPPRYAPRSLLGRLNLGDLVSLLAQGFAAFRALPVAPVLDDNCDCDPVPDGVADKVQFRSAIAHEQQVEKQLELAGRAAGTLLGAQSSASRL